RRVPRMIPPALEGSFLFGLFGLFRFVEEVVVCRPAAGGFATSALADSACSPAGRRRSRLYSCNKIRTDRIGVRRLFAAFAGRGKKKEKAPCGMSPPRALFPLSFLPQKRY